MKLGRIGEERGYVRRGSREVRWNEGQGSGGNEEKKW